MYNLLVIGLDVATLAASAKEAGYNVFAVDYFGDPDLKTSSSYNLSIIVQRENISCGLINRDFKPDNLLVLAEKILKKNKVDGILLSSGLEDYPHILNTLNKLAPIIGNSPEKINRVRNRESFFTELDRVGISHPITSIAENFEEAKEIAQDIGFPLIVKPMKGSGGYGIKKLWNLNELKLVYNSSFVKKFLVQEYIDGRAASASIICTPSDSSILTINEQILGKGILGQKQPFGYCGNIVPLKVSKKIIKRCKEVVEKLVDHFQLNGSNGVDFIITNKGQPKVVEVNPRFQGTLECIERVLGINLVKAHIEASILGVLPTVGETKEYYVRLILYALKNSKIPALEKFEGIRDLPLKGVIVKEGEPICSIITGNSDRKFALKKAYKLANLIYSLIK